MRSPVRSEARLYFNTGKGQSERESSAAMIKGLTSDGFQRLAFDLPKKTVVALRFDPFEVPGEFTVRNILIRAPHRIIASIPNSDILSANQITTRAERKGEVEFTTADNANDPNLSLRLHGPIDYARAYRHYVVRRLSMGLLLVVIAFAAAFLIASGTISIPERATSGIRRIGVLFDPVARKLSGPGFMRFDSASIWFYIFCLGCFLFATIADVNGSSIGVYSSTYGYGIGNSTLVGVPRNIRSDEWSSETPAILNQYLKPRAFDSNHSWVGDDGVALLANLPVSSMDIIFRPQFWSFFILPLDFAFAAYWQSKALLLVTGVFTFLLFVTRSTLWAIGGSLCYLFSPFVQWAYSYPSALPEMVGTVCWAIVGSCFITIGKNPLALAIAVIGTAFSAVNAALCAYLPHLIPVCWLAILVVVFWCIAFRRRILAARFRIRRVIAALALIFAIGTAGLKVYRDTRRAVSGIAHTTYPGQRVFSGNNLPLPILTGHFLQWTETENHFPDSLQNMSEGSGFLWLAPATLFGLGSIRLQRWRKFALIALWCCVALICIWLFSPVPAGVAKWTGMARTWGSRCMPALGLANIAILAIYMSSPRRKSLPKAKCAIPVTILRICCIGMASAIVLELTNYAFASYFTWQEVLVGVIAATAFVSMVLFHRPIALAVTLVASQALVFGSVNPVQRGLAPITESPLFRFVSGRPDLKQARWMVYSEQFINSGFLAATGADVYTGIIYLPDIDHFALLRSNGLNVEAFNRDGLRLARALPAGVKSFADVPGPAEVMWNVSPSDPILRQLGIRYFAFDKQPPSAVLSQLIPLSDHPVSTFWLYRLR